MSRKIDRPGLIPPSPTEADYQAYATDEDVAAEQPGPLALFAEWLAAAAGSEPSDPNAMTLATVDADGLPDARTVLLKGFDEAGFVFYTNLESAKGRELLANPKAALLFHWKSLRRQVRIRGPVSAVSDAEADAYFSTRARASQIGAWASDQSRPMQGAVALEKAVAAYALKFGVSAVPRPPHWSGFRVEPLAMEFWRARRFRLHERMLFARPDPAAAWSMTALYP
ncbi:MAG TPA: pyridoxamine 5'-phosphate oxidase [Caulobacteraceae bacterium]